jgi:hypothetical protein
MFSVANMNPQGVQITQSLSSRVGSEGSALSRGLMPMPNVVHNDPILKVFEQIEEGTTARYLEHSWKQPSVTWLGKLLDRYIWKAGEFSTPAPAPSEPNSTNITATQGAIANTTRHRPNSRSSLYYILLQKIIDYETLYAEDFKLSTSDFATTRFSKWVSFLKCAFNINHWVSGEECRALPVIAERKNYCPPIASNEIICLPFSVSEDIGEKPYCLTENPRTVHVHVIPALDSKFGRIELDLLNACFAQYRHFCNNNCLTCDSLTEYGSPRLLQEERTRIGKTVIRISDFTKLKFTAVAAEGELTKWDQRQLGTNAWPFLEDCDVYVKVVLFEEKILKGCGYTVMAVVAVSAMCVGITVFKKLNACFTARREIALGKDDCERGTDAHL